MVNCRRTSNIIISDQLITSYIYSVNNVKIMIYIFFMSLTVYDIVRVIRNIRIYVIFTMFRYQKIYYF